MFGRETRKIAMLKLVILTLVTLGAAEDLNFTFNGFQSANLRLDGIAGVAPNGLLRLTNETKQNQGHAFYPNSITFKNSSNGTVFSFSTTFVFAIRSEYAGLSGHGIAFVVAPTQGLPRALPSQYLGLFNESNTGNDTNHVFAVEFDTIQSKEFNDIDDNHVGIDINGLQSKKAAPAAYYDKNNGRFRNLTLISGQQMKVWVEYDGAKKQIDVTLAPINVDKPYTPLLSLNLHLLPILNETMYVGFSSSTGLVLTSHYVLGWSFKINGHAQELLVSKLPKLSRIGGKKRSKLLTIGVLILSVSLILPAVYGLIYVIRRKRKFAELLEFAWPNATVLPVQLLMVQSSATPQVLKFQILRHRPISRQKSFRHFLGLGFWSC